MINPGWQVLFILSIVGLNWPLNSSLGYMYGVFVPTWLNYVGNKCQVLCQVVHTWSTYVDTSPIINHVVTTHYKVSPPLRHCPWAARWVVSSERPRPWWANKTRWPWDGCSPWMLMPRCWRNAPSWGRSCRGNLWKWCLVLKMWLIADIEWYSYNPLEVESKLRWDTLVEIGWPDTYLPQKTMVSAVELGLYRSIIHFQTRPYDFMNEEGAKGHAAPTNAAENTITQVRLQNAVFEVPC